MAGVHSLLCPNNFLFNVGEDGLSHHHSEEDEWALLVNGMVPLDNPWPAWLSVSCRFRRALAFEIIKVSAFLQRQCKLC